MSQDKKSKIRELVGEIVKSYQEEPDIIKFESKSPVKEAIVVKIIEDLRDLIFAGFFGNKRLKVDLMEYYAGELVERITYNLSKQIGRALEHRKEGETVAQDSGEAERITYVFLEKLPKIRSILATDVEATYQGDPAVYSKEEIILSYPGIYAILVSRIAHELYLLDVPLIPRMMTEYAHGLTGIDIHPGASIGHHFFIDHGTGIVIGETTTIGNYVKIYQGVTLGALSTRGGQLLHGVKRHPTIEDNVTIYSGSSIFGSSTVIGEGVVIGSNAFIIKSVPSGTRVSIRNPELQFKEDKKQQPVEFKQEEAWFYQI